MQFGVAWVLLLVVLACSEERWEFIGVRMALIKGSRGNSSGSQRSDDWTDEKCRVAERHAC